MDLKTRLQSSGLLSDHVSTYSHNEVVGINDQDEGHAVDEEAVEDKIAAVMPVLSQVVSATSCQVAFGDIPEGRI